MYCKYCGELYTDETNFCAKCGKKIGKNKFKRAQKESAKRKIFIGIGTIVLLAVLIVLCIFVKEYTYRIENTKTVSDDVESIEVVDGKTLSLVGEYPYLKQIKTNGSIYFDGEFPELEVLECATIEIEGDLEEIINGEMFPKLEQVCISLSNEQIDEYMINVMEAFEQRREQGMLPQYNKCFSHSVTDFYGKWITEDESLSITFLDSGEVWISDETGMFEKKVMKFVMGELFTLSFTSENIWGDVDVAYDMKYSLFGDTLTITVLEENIELHKK